MLASGVFLYRIEEVHLAFPKTVNYGSLGILRELGVSYDEMVEVVP
jgi:hypothetical protein